MNTLKINIRTVCSIIGILGTAPIALGQVPQTSVSSPNTDSFDFSWQSTQGQNMAPQSVTRNATPETPEQQANYRQQSMLDHDATVSLSMGHYAQAEAEARSALSLGLDCGTAYEVLGKALTEQGKIQEALGVYRLLSIDGKNGPVGQVRYLLPYAQLSLEAGQWREALAVYNKALSILPDVGPHPEQPTVHDKDLMQTNSHFSPDVPAPAALATALHLARGIVLSAMPSGAGTDQDAEAMSEYMKALQSAPDSSLTNYYYGIGWQKLAPAERAKFGNAQQAKAALEKAVKLGKPDVKEAAQKALLVAAKP